ncbi:uncharacterized protein LOC119392906 [Rhipicephalus sanguineus]|uniref:uncharacterized protein LOC119392906 n=1 Tax=Rhipicephalus sanguineus TaxID=34632 RepID=UPI0020C4AE65|nr:uncharacterized protein LOC119392906 [Rhipicephalus sanguineus]
MELQHLNDAGVQVNTLDLCVTGRRQLITISKVENEKALAVMSGICCFELFYNISEIFTEARLSGAARNFCISNEDAVLLCFMKLYHDTSFSLLAVLFGIHRTTAANIFKEAIMILAGVLKHAIFLPSKEAVTACMTVYFKEYPDTRMVLDCTEIPCERPKDLKSRILTYSHYKRTYTAKVLVSETPGGLISYVSAAYGGKASDSFITKDTGLLETCIPAVDAVMVDKGFLIQELCKEKNIKMIRPPFLKQPQLTTEEAVTNQAVARARVHVERAIQRMKLFKILQNRLDLDLLPYIDAIITVIVGTTNLSKPIFSEKRFLRNDANAL